MTAKIVEPYHSLADIYDHVMRHVDYDHWAAYIRALFDRFGHQPQALVDLACGTGNVALELCALGYQVVAGVDASESMLRVAREKAMRAGRDIQFVHRDLRHLDDLGFFDAAVCMYDSFNYLLSMEEIDAALNSIHRILHPGGIFIFDVCTERNSRRYFSNVRDQESGSGFSYERHSYYDAKERLQINLFTLRFAGWNSTVEERHVQRIYPVADLLGALAASPMELLGAFDGFTFDRGSESSDRIHFVLRRPPA